ncbi:hypothetical protein [Aquabacterium sp. J223]|jgi:hypothetical protein|uniref:hypothetical protein n=1 Tax=Aquabacterium sp. J223 TaxID=2898431 RepID=UPI0021AE09D7|nr:hypothetical protein [Aquabacterium sp. J223]UUX97009.1 hypothetical protein LRS07_07050 [Aquabacterium sp. J223]
MTPQTTPVPTTEWVHRFAQRLGQRSPMLRDDAEELGTTLWQEMRVFTCPERAAEQFANSLFGQQ